MTEYWIVCNFSEFPTTNILLQVIVIAAIIGIINLKLANWKIITLYIKRKGLVTALGSKQVVIFGESDYRFRW